jgi:hypothetical protein
MERDDRNKRIAEGHIEGVALSFAGPRRTRGAVERTEWIREG